MPTPGWLSDLSDGQMHELLRHSTQRNWERGATIFTPATHPSSLYLLERGLVRIYRLSKDGDETTFGYVAPGEVFGELTAFGDFPRESFAAAVHPSRVWKIPLDAFQQVLSTHPGAVLEITRQIGQRMKRIQNRVENLVFKDVRARVAAILIELAEDFGQTEGGQRVLDFEITQSELATLVGSTRQTVNGSLRELEESGLIQRDGRRVVIAKADELARVARAGL